MGLLRNIRIWTQKCLLDRGFLLERINRTQVIPTVIAAPELYRRPDDYSRLLKPWHDPAYSNVFTDEVTSNTMLSRMKLYYLHRFITQVRDLSGDVFEAGTGSGGSSRLLLNAVKKQSQHREMWLLDTFEGYQKVDAVRDGAHVQVNQCRCASFEDVHRLLQEPTVPVHLIKGLIPATLDEVKAVTFAFAHIDVNLHEPTLAAFEFCLQRLVIGGIIVFDDYGWPATYGARCAIDEVATKHGQNIIYLGEQAFLIKR